MTLFLRNHLQQKFSKGFGNMWTDVCYNCLNSVLNLILTKLKINRGSAVFWTTKHSYWGPHKYDVLGVYFLIVFNMKK